MNVYLMAWCVAAGVLVAVELATGTFYVLMMAAGATAGALSALAGYPLQAQLIWAAIVGAAATVAWNRYRAKTSPGVASERNKDVNLDIGESVEVKEPAPSGKGLVRYRGADWQARSEDGTPLVAGEYTIRAIEGSCLVLGHN